MDTCKVTVLTSESVDEILWCDHSNEISLVLLSHGTVRFTEFEKMKFGIFLEFLLWPLLRMKGLRNKTTAGDQALNH